MSAYERPEDEEPTTVPSAPEQPDLPGTWPGDSYSALERMEVEVTLRAVEVIGSEPEAMRWLGTPIGALNYATPVSLLYDAAGRDAVTTVLGRLEHSVL